MGLLRKKKDKDKDYDSRQSATPPIADPYNDADLYTMEDTTSALSGESRSSGGAPPRKEHNTSKNNAGPWFTSRQIRLFKKPPPAEEAAHSGPPRYDWVDIETSAAIRVQAAFRRRRVMAMMEEQGLSTAAVRNMVRRRNAAKEATTNPAQDFINLFNCCGVDLGLGGGNKEKYWDVTREMETARYEQHVREKAEREEALRKAYKRKSTGARDALVENVEVVQ